MSALKTPCIGICSTGVGDSVCRGCKRFAHEVIQWNGYSEQERAAIWQRLDALLSAVVSNRIVLRDEAKLKQQLQLHQVRFNSGQNANALIYLAIRSFGKHLPSLEAIGCVAHPQWQALTMEQLKEAIEATFYDLSCAHYERYFPGHI